MSDENTEIEKVIDYYTREITDNRSQIDTIIKNFSSKVDLSVIIFAIDYAKLKNKCDISFIIDTLNEWIRFDLNTASKVKEHLGLSSCSPTVASDNNSDDTFSVVTDIEKEEIIREFKKKIGNRIGIEKDITELFKEVEPKVVNLCIDYCTLNKKTNLPSFIEIINDWKSSGLTTSEKVHAFFKASNINLKSKTIKPNNTADNKNKTLDPKNLKSPVNKLDNIKNTLTTSKIRENNKLIFNEDSFNQIEYYYRKHFNDDSIEVNSIKEFCEQIDNSIVFRALVYAKSTDKNNYKYLESFIHRLKEKNISTLQELNNYLN